MSNLATISILQSLVIGCLVFTFFKYPSLPHFKSQWALLLSKVHHYFFSSHNGLKIEYPLCDTYILGFRWRNAHLTNVQIEQIMLFWFIYIKAHNWFKWNQARNSDVVWILTCFNLHISIFCVKFWSLKMKCRRCDYMLIGCCETLVFSIHSYLIVS